MGSGDQLRCHDQKRPAVEGRRQDSPGGFSVLVHDKVARPSPAADAGAGVYVHFPFCARKCPYCDFNSYAGRPEPAYFEAVKAEIRARAPDFRGIAFSSMYFGGGTPSLADPREIGAVVETARRSLDFFGSVETTIEVNPGTVDAARLAACALSGVNRVSIGAQSFDPDVLKSLGRIHGPEEALTAVATARAAGIAHVAVDLMYGAPRQSAASFLRSVKIAAGSGADHLSLYALTIHPDTPFGGVDSETLHLPSEDDVVGMCESAREWLEKDGWGHYEISNWARPGAECVHNVSCWRGGYYLGAGAGAHGHVPGYGVRGTAYGSRGTVPGSRIRYANVNDPAVYAAAVGRGERPEKFSEEVDAGARAREIIYTGLRMASGLDLQELGTEAPEKVVAVVARAVPALEEEGLVNVEGGRLRLTARGQLFADNVALRLI